MREGWKTVPLKELCYNYKNDIVDGPFGANLKREHYTAEGVPVLKIQNIKPFNIVLKKMDYVDAKKAEELSRHAYKKGDIIITKLGLPLGISAIVEEPVDDGIIVADLVRVRAEKIDTKYLCYHLNSPVTNDYLNAQQGGATRPRVKITAVRELPINVPSPEEQKRIVAILDEAFAGIDTAIANTEKNLANARELFESYLNSVFTQRGEGWTDDAVGNIAEHRLGKMLDKNKNKGEFKAYLRNLNVQWFVVQTDNVLEMRFEEDEYEKYLVLKGDLLICEGGYPGRAAIWEKDHPIFYQKALHRVRCKEPRYNRWLLYYLFISDTNGSLKKCFTGTGIQHFTGQSLKKLVVPIPPSSQIGGLLERFELLHEQTQQLESIYQQKLNSLKELKQSLLQKAFSGELTSKLDKLIDEAVA